MKLTRKQRKRLERMERLKQQAHVAPQPSIEPSIEPSMESVATEAVPVPAAPVPSKGLTVVINTCRSYMENSIPVILNSLAEANVPKTNIHIVVGENTECDDNVVDGVAYHYRRWVNIDNNAMLWVTQERPACLTEWIIYLHDTTYVHKDFWTNCIALMETFEEAANCYRIHAPFSMCIGFYRTEWLFMESVLKYMSKIINTEIGRKNQVKNNLGSLEDVLFHFANNTCRTLPNHYNVIERDRKMYGTDIPRIVEYYEIPGVYKVKANWGQGQCHTNL